MYQAIIDLKMNHSIIHYICIPMWLTELLAYACIEQRWSRARKKMSLSDNSFNNLCHCPLPSKQSSSGRSVLLQLFIIWTDKGTILNIQDTEGQMYKSKPTSYQNQQHGNWNGFLLRVNVILRNVVAQNCRFPFLTALLIVVCLQWMAAKGRGEKPWTSGDRPWLWHSLHADWEG